MCKKAMISKNYKELDEAIKQKLPPYLYNGGKGKMDALMHDSSGDNLKWERSGPLACPTFD